MLINFRVANYRAFQEPQELTMRRARGLASDGGSPAWDPQISPIAVIYGPNASGKSTLYRAMQFVRRAVTSSYRSWAVDGGVPGATPFLLDSDSSEAASEFEVEFVADDGLRYQFGFQASAARIEAEWLYSYRKSSRTTLYERNLSDESPMYFGNSFRGNRVAITDALDQRPNALFISVAMQLGNEILSSANRWLTQRLRTYNARDYKSEHRHLADRLRTDEATRMQLSDVLSKADLGITEISIAENELDPVILERAFEAARILSDEQSTELSKEDFSKFMDSAKREIRFAHQTSAGPVPFPLSWESDGTQALLSFASVAMKALKTGSTMVVDEIDSSLHPTIVAELIRVFASGRTNPRQAQLIVTTHDASLLNASMGEGDLLARDQVWVTEKDVHGASTLTAISEYRTPRKNENLMRGYLTGRYGGIPMPSMFAAICALEESS